MAKGKKIKITKETRTISEHAKTAKMDKPAPGTPKKGK